MNTSIGHKYWTQVLDTSIGHKYWTQVLDTSIGHNRLPRGQNLPHLAMHPCRRRRRRRRRRRVALRVALLRPSGLGTNAETETGPRGRVVRY